MSDPTTWDLDVHLVYLDAQVASTKLNMELFKRAHGMK